MAGDGNGCIHVFGYDENQDTTSFEAHNGQIMSLAVHPKNSYVLSSSHEDHLIKLWHWDKYWDFEKGPWVCTRTFEGHSNKVSHAIFNPDGTDSFASASWDGTVKVCVYARFRILFNPLRTFCGLLTFDRYEIYSIVWYGVRSKFL